MHILGVSNTLSDKESRRASGSSEWALDSAILSQAIQCSQFTPDIDLFFSRLNYKFKPFVAFNPYPEACAINAFGISWSKYLCYAFPPFNILPKLYKKFKQTRQQDCN